MTQKNDYVLLLVTILLLSIGIIEVYSSSYYLTLNLSSNVFLTRHIRSVVIGLGAMLVFWRLISYKFIEKLAYFAMIPLFVFLFLLYTPMAKTVNYSTRWVNLFGFSLMPSEWAKIFVIIIISKALVMRDKFIKSYKLGVLPYLGFGAFISAIIYFQPNMSDALIVMCLVIILIFIAGIKWRHFVSTIVLGGIASGAMIFSKAYRASRFLIFFDPFSSPLDEGYQIVQSLYALGSGGFLGVGLGMSTQNKLYIPEAQNDFILATIGEEWGFLGIVILLALFLVLIQRGISIAVSSEDRFAFFLASGLTFLIALHVLINFMVVGSLMPITGITLPFISYGGNSLIVLLIAVGILLNIYKTNHR